MRCLNRKQQQKMRSINIRVHAKFQGLSFQCLLYTLKPVFKSTKSSLSSFEESDLIIALFDSSTNLSKIDAEILNYIRKASVPFITVFDFANNLFFIFFTFELSNKQLNSLLPL